MSTAERIEDILRATEGLLDEQAFLGTYPFPFLVQESTRPSKGPVDAQPVPTGRTTTRLTQASVPTGDGFAMGGQVWVYAICPRDPERNEGAVRLGRDPDNDVVIEDDSVSSVHAEFTLEFAPDDTKQFLVADLDSSNGTFVDGERVPPRTPTQLDDQSSVRFGPAAKFQFFTAPAFYQFLSFYRRIKTDS